MAYLSSDVIGYLPPHLSPPLLQVIQEGYSQPGGGETEGAGSLMEVWKSYSDDLDCMQPPSQMYAAAKFTWNQALRFQY